MTADILSVTKPKHYKPVTLTTSDAQYWVQWMTPMEMIVKYAPDGSKMKFTPEQLAYLDERGWATHIDECVAWFAIRE
jgi:hypothetical protein